MSGKVIKKLFMTFKTICALPTSSPPKFYLSFSFTTVNTERKKEEEKKTNKMDFFFIVADADADDGVCWLRIAQVAKRFAHAVDAGLTGWCVNKNTKIKCFDV